MLYKQLSLLPQVLLVTSRKDDSQWIVPGGGVEPEEEEEVAAVREVWEEAGVCGTLGRCLGVFEVSLSLIFNYKENVLYITKPAKYS